MVQEFRKTKLSLFNEKEIFTAMVDIEPIEIHDKEKYNNIYDVKHAVSDAFGRMVLKALPKCDEIIINISYRKKGGSK